MNIIDSHLHLFNLENGEYHWLAPENPPFWSDKDLIAHSFNEADLLLNQPLKLAGFVHIEAGFNNKQPWQEINWLEQHCQLPFRSVAAIDLTLPTKEFAEQLNTLLTYSSLVGCRHILDDNTQALLNNEQVKANFALLNQHALTFDVQMPLTDSEVVSSLCALIKQNPEINFMIDHAGWPPLALTQLTDEKVWFQALKKLSRFRNVAIKCSGWEMLDRHYQQSWLNQVIQQCINVFGSSRVLLASNFPLTLFTMSYQDYWQAITTAIPAKQQQALLYNNAQRWYKISLSKINPPPTKNIK